MYNITLICTRHSTKGKTNAKELLKIIRKINPEIIFVERSYSQAKKIYIEQRDGGLEENAIKEYSKKNKIAILPVDTYRKNKNFWGNYNYMLTELGNTFGKTIEYKNLWKEWYFFEMRYGFIYLNSKEFEKLHKKFYILENNYVKEINNKKLLRIVTLFYETDDKRENEMLNNIYNYSKTNKYNRALLLIGCGHRNSIIKKIQEYKKKEKIKLNWRFNSYKNILEMDKLHITGLYTLRR